MKFWNKNNIFYLFLLIFSIFAIYSLVNKSQFIIDNLLGIISVSLIYFFYEKLKLKKVGFFLIGFALLVHNLGTFGFYSWSWKFLQYDNIVHFISSGVAAYIVFNLVIFKFHNVLWPKDVFKKNIYLFIFLIFSATVTLGIFIELTEFTGQKYLGNGEGLLLAGVGDSDPTNTDMNSQYTDTMNDILVNIFGALAGAFGYYQFRIKNKNSLS